MREREFGRSGVKVSEIGLGTWQLGSADWGEVDEQTALATLQAAFDSGVNIFDTADVYGLGLHCLPTELMKRGEVFDWLRVLQQEGKVKNFGASVESVEEALMCLEQEGLCSLQIIFNIFRQKPITELFEKASAKGVALLVRLPLASGLLSGKFSRETTFDARDHRHYNRDGQQFNVGETFAGLPFEKGVELAEALKPMVPEDLTMAEMALRWILDFDAVSTIIPGATNPAQAAANSTASDLLPLSPAFHETLKGFYKTEVTQHIRGPY
jgi:aryl-alcohol dehydrogenase-like predicted oxidoreductase